MQDKIVKEEHVKKICHNANKNKPTATCFMQFRLSFIDRMH